SFEYPSLPITKNKEELTSFIESNSVVIVRGATGSGKTTQLPQFILDHYNEKNAPCNIVVTQPRKIGATSIARWVAAQRKCTLGSLVGYQIGLERMATEHTRLIYMTTGVLLQKLVLAKSLTEYSHIFVDEVHERSEEMDFLLLVLRKLLHSNSCHVKIILMSATINCREFADYFATPVWGKMSPAYVFEVEGAPYTTEEFYLDDLQKLLPCRVEMPNTEDLFILPSMYNLAISLIQSFDEMEGKDFSSKAEKDGGMTLTERGSVLVFLPGLHEINTMKENLTKLVHQRLQVYPLHSSVTLEEQNGVFLSPVPGYRKVILSTNIAESSVTVPDVKYVIDFCLARHLVCDKDTNYQSLHLTWASKTNCNQRKGRAGRVSKGYCYRLVTKAFWINDIPEYMIPEMQLAPLSTILLKVKLLDMGDPRSLLSTALSPPNLSDIVRTVIQLIEMGALSAKTDGDGQTEDGDLTFLGRVLAHLPVNLNLGKLIVLGHVFGCLDECLIIAASLSLKSFFAIPAMQQLAGYSVFTLYSVQVAELYKDLKKRVSQFNMHVPEDAPSPDPTSIHRQKFILQIVIAGAFYPNYFFQQEIDEQQVCKELSGFNPQRTVMVRNIPPYNFLYYKQLQSLFRLCGQVKTITFDSSRAYVEFHGKSKDSGVLPEVTLALLMAHRSFKLELSVYPTEQIELCAGRRAISHLRFSRYGSVVRLAARHVSPNSDVLGVRGVSIEDPHITKENLFVCLFLQVFFLDFGNTGVVSSSSLRELPSDLLSAPFQAREFQVAGMRPSAQSIILGNQWSSCARECFISVVKQQSVVVSVYSILHGVMRVDLLVKKDAEPTSVVDILVEEGHAVKAEECVESQQSHEDLKSMYDDLEKGTFIPGSVNSSWRDRKNEEEEIINNLLTQLSSKPRNVKTRLIWFLLMSLVSPRRTVAVERNSINVFTLNENPHFKHRRMLVAGSVAISILLDNTSILPDIPGLPALVMMLFTPVMELRTNEERSYYTGALFGLGFNGRTQEAVLPENDIELQFDVKMDATDIIEINALRMAINSLLCNGPSSTLHQSPDRISRQQEHCRDRLTRLFIRSPPREAVPQTYQENEGKWNQVDPSHRMDVAERGGRSVRGALFQLHSPIVLNG
uniref:ATP-dependent RNA helicase TDRD9 n=1 Tax=Fundulus heteroclitus TaxID=8078 RepID=A0A3Q2P5S3_FUNHE